MRTGGVVATVALLAVGAVVGLLFFARPTMSKVENRNLTAFPALTWDSFWSGKFFSDLDLWYSDTYPLREQMVSADQTISAMHGVPTQTQMVGGTKQADELPPAGQQPAQSSSSSSSSSSAQTDATKSEQKKNEKVEVPTEAEMAAAVQDQITAGMYVKGDAAYNVYYFSQEATQGYADALNTLADAVDGQATVYSIVVPNSSGVVLSDQEIKDLGGTNQEEAIRYFYSLYNSKVHGVDAMSVLKEHKSEYVYYRTDHHWTTLGSYYGYEAFCKEKGIKPVNRDSLEYKNMGDFLGSFYFELNSEAMAANPDYYDAWYPKSTNKLTLFDTDGSQAEYEIITDTSNTDAFGKSMTHIMGDQPLERIDNPTLSDGSSCLVIKDSFADSFVPWLVDHYQTVWVADFRYFEGSYKSLIKDNSIKDVIVLNNIALAGGGAVAPAILGRL